MGCGSLGDGGGGLARARAEGEDGLGTTCLADADGEPDVLSATGGWAVCLSTHRAPRAPGWVLVD